MTLVNDTGPASEHDMTTAAKHSRPAFTLVELMVSIALVIILVLGIAQVFSLTGETVGTGQALADAARDHRAARTVLADDFSAALTDAAPLFIIHNQNRFAWSSRADRDGDLDTDITTADLGNLGEGETPLAMVQSNRRVHRTDMISFFKARRQPRATGELNAFSSSTVASASWVTYGHVRLANPRDVSSALNYLTDYFGPGEGDETTNPRHYFASDWVLGRRAILLAPGNNASTPDWTDEAAYVIDPFLTLSPLAMNSYAARPVGASTMANLPAADLYLAPILAARFDRAGVSLDRFARRFAQHLFVYPDPPADNAWWTIPDRDLIPPYDNATGSNSDYGTTLATMLYRSNCNPFLIRSQSNPVLDPDDVALANTYFVGSVASFVVEFAGDFFTQNNNPTDNDAGGSGADFGRYGWVQSAEPDGIIDFVVDRTPDTTDPSKWLRSTRFYGLPRDIDGNGAVLGRPVSDQANDLRDVVPLRDLRRITRSSDPIGDPVQAEIEKTVPANKTDYGPAASGLAPDETYTVAWTSGGPALVRIVIQIDNPEGRLASPQTYQTVYRLR